MSPRTPSLKSRNIVPPAILVPPPRRLFSRSRGAGSHRRERSSGTPCVRLTPFSDGRARPAPGSLCRSLVSGNEKRRFGRRSVTRPFRTCLEKSSSAGGRCAAAMFGASVYGTRMRRRFEEFLRRGVSAGGSQRGGGNYARKKKAEKSGANLSTVEFPENCVIPVPRTERSYRSRSPGSVKLVALAWKRKLFYRGAKRYCRIQAR